jgi:phosphate transport system substrate-binding protein
MGAVDLQPICKAQRKSCHTRRIASMSTRKLMALTIAMAFCACFTASLPAALAEQKQAIRISGAGLLSEAVQVFVDGYAKEKPDCSFVIMGATTGIGFQKLMDGEAELAMVTRKITDQETKKAESMGLILHSKLIGHVGLAVITNIKNPVNEMTMDQLAGIFRGDIVNWSEIGGPNEHIRVTNRAVPETGAGVLFQEKVLKGAPYSKDSTVMSSYNTTVMVCGKTFGIGYIPTTTVYFDTLADRGVKIIRIKKDAASAPYQLASGVARETMYPISIPFLMYWNAKMENPCTKGFADFSQTQTQ